MSLYLAHRRNSVNACYVNKWTKSLGRSSYNVFVNLRVTQSSLRPKRWGTSNLSGTKGRNVLLSAKHSPWLSSVMEEFQTHLLGLCRDGQQDCAGICISVPWITELICLLWLNNICLFINYFEIYAEHPHMPGMMLSSRDSEMNNIIPALLLKSSMFVRGKKHVKRPSGEQKIWNLDF